ncbi:ubiquitin-like protein Pup [Saccharopolyspora hattusasensis]|uniref:ubiquitin-like protein Pup n=1 Tax=Saccharopolyspora hattusasensis TaxID=1128679 RepID=UPI003D96924B
MVQQQSRHERQDDDEQDSHQGETARTTAHDKEKYDKFMEELDELLPQTEEEADVIFKNYIQKGGQ